MNRSLHVANHAEPRQLFPASQQYVCFDLPRCLLNRRRRRYRPAAVFHVSLTYSVLRGPLRLLPRPVTMPCQGMVITIPQQHRGSHLSPSLSARFPHSRPRPRPRRGQSRQARSPAGCTKLTNSRAAVWPISTRGDQAAGGAGKCAQHCTSAWRQNLARFR
jgi:hypothetical protein